MFDYLNDLIDVQRVTTIVLFYVLLFVYYVCLDTDEKSIVRNGNNAEYKYVIGKN